MSIQTEIARISQNISNTYTVLSALGADMPTEQTSDNLALTAGTVKTVLYSEQTLTDQQKTQARENIGAAGTADIPDVTGKLDKSGGTMTGILTAQNNTSYATKQVRNIFLIADGETLPDGSNGDICLVYTQ